MNSTAFSVCSESLPLSRCHEYIKLLPNSLIFFNSFIKARMTGNDTCSGISKANKLSKVGRSQICSRHIPRSEHRKEKTTGICNNSLETSKCYRNKNAFYFMYRQIRLNCINHTQISQINTILIYNDKNIKMTLLVHNCSINNRTEYKRSIS